jgi:hypothetical protein
MEEGMKPTVVWKPDAYSSLKVAVQSKTALETTGIAGG